MKIVIDIPNNVYNTIESDWVDWFDGTLVYAIRNGIVLPQNSTNGEMIKAMFPNAHIEYWAEYSTYNVEFPNDNAVKHFSYDWWNAPYERSIDADTNRD